MRRIWTFWLIAQILLPFTAPFPVCDLTDLLTGVPQHGAPPNPQAPDSRADAGFAYAPPLVTTAGRLRLVVAAEGPVAYVDGPSDSSIVSRPLIFHGVPLRLQQQSTVLRV